MGIFRRTTKPTTHTASPTADAARPSVSAADLADATRILDQWADALGDGDKMEPALEAISYRGGWRGLSQAIVDGPGATDRAWRWWTEASIFANSLREDVLAARIFLFALWFVDALLPRLSVARRAAIGLDDPGSDRLAQLAETAIDSLSRVDPNRVIHVSDNDTVSYTAGDVLSMARSV